MAAEFELYKDKAGEYRWRLQAENNKIIAASARGYRNQADCEDRIALVRTLAATVSVKDKTGIQKGLTQPVLSAGEFQLYKDKAGEYRWRLQAENNKIIATSAEGYKNKADCEHGIALVRTLAATVSVKYKTGTQKGRFRRQRSRLENILRNHPATKKALGGKPHPDEVHRGKTPKQLMEEAHADPTLAPLLGRIKKVNEYRTKVQGLAKKRLAGEIVSEEEEKALAQEGETINSDYQKMIGESARLLRQSVMVETYMPAFQARPESQHVYDNLDRYFENEEIEVIESLGVDCKTALRDTKDVLEKRRHQALYRIGPTQLGEALEQLESLSESAILPESPEGLSESGPITFGGDMGFWTSLVATVVTVVVAVVVVAVVVLAVIANPVVVIPALIAIALLAPPAVAIAAVVVEAVSDSIDWLSDLMTAVPDFHVFVLMLENRSFDHMLGLSGLTGKTIDGKDAEIAGPPKTVGVIPGAEQTLVGRKDPPHEFEHVETQMANGNSGFIKAYEGIRDDEDFPGKYYPEDVMRCFTADQLPVITALAKEFVVCDHWYSSLPGPTWPNRNFVHAATSGGRTDSPSGMEQFWATAFDSFEATTIFDRLDDAGLKWEVFHGDALPHTLQLDGMLGSKFRGRFEDLYDFRDVVKYVDYRKSYVFIEPDYGDYLPPEPEDFRCGNSMHPKDDATRGESLIKYVYESIRRNDRLWKKSVLIVTWDEHGGFYNHEVPPKTVPPDASSDGFDFKQLGIRVPTLVISPRIPKNIIDHTVYDHTSILATLEKMHDLAPLTERDRHANTLEHLFTLAGHPSARGSDRGPRSEPRRLGIGTGRRQPTR